MKMATLQLKVQYFQDSTPQDVPCREENFTVRELSFALPVEQTALVLIDLWNVHHIDSWIERAEAVTRDIIAPLIGRARDSGLTIVQAPSPGVLANFRNFSISWGRRPIDRHTTALAERPWCIPFAMEIEQNQGARAR